MGKQSRLRAARRTHAGTAGAPRDRLVRRPFEGLSSEGDWIALREFVPAATARLRLIGEFADREAIAVTVLPEVMPSVIRRTGEVLVSVQAPSTSTDPSRDIGAALVGALLDDHASPVEAVQRIPNPPRLQDLVDPAEPLEVVVHDGFDFWLTDMDDPTGELAAMLERVNASVAATRRLTSVDSAYWTAVRDRNHVRWVMPQAEAQLIDALARLHAAGESSLGDGTRLVGSFRAYGLLVPVWDLPSEMDADAVEEPAAAFANRLGDALAMDTPLDAAQRRAREGLRNRQLTIR